MSSAKRRLYCHGLNVLIVITNYMYPGSFTDILILLFPFKSNIMGKSKQILNNKEPLGLCRVWWKWNNSEIYNVIKMLTPLSYNYWNIWSLYLGLFDQNMQIL